jgi:hypothetical protein
VDSFSDQIALLQSGRGIDIGVTVSATFQIQSKLLDEANNPLVIDIAEGAGSPAPKRGALLDAFTRTQGKNQLWKSVLDPGGSGFFGYPDFSVGT